jgi:hypothetical protein
MSFALFFRSITTVKAIAPKLREKVTSVRAFRLNVRCEQESSGDY